MKKFIFCFIFFTFVFNIEGKSNEMSPSQLNYEQVINVGKMDSHDKLFTLFFKTREKAVLAKGEDLNYINDFPQDLYYLNNTTGAISPLITYDWFPKKAKSLNMSSSLPIFPEDYAYYLLNDNETLIMISGIKSIRNNYIFNLRNGNLDTLTKDKNYKLRFVFSLLKDCGFANVNETYECTFYKPLISENLIR